ncbi:polyprenyl synthetase family protein [Polaromonas sp. YR568]|uniref:polyprenyl synthetase family protein n=1 Tax=Polaromonas sp. YR568 TaxID=1855301 RepID=UPI0031383633
MSMMTRIEQALSQPFMVADSATAPPRLMAAMRHAVFPGGARIRPQLCIAVAKACGEDAPDLTNAAAASIELLHCASLVHDDMPCFDDADTRRGQTTVHKQFGEPLALLTGDALIVLAYQTLARAGARHPHRLARLLMTVCEGTGTPDGIVAGQAWECEPRVQLGRYQRAKTGALFVASTCAGAQAAGTDPEPWRRLGDALGEAYQVADDIRDVMGADQLGKPVGQDAQHGRPSTAADLGLLGAVDYFRKLIQSAVQSVPACASREAMQQLVLHESERLLPQSACDQIAVQHAASQRRAVA